MSKVKQANFADDVKGALRRHPSITTINELAASIGFHRNTVSRAIHRHCFPRVLKRVCRELHLSLPC